MKIKNKVIYFDGVQKLLRDTMDIPKEFDCDNFKNKLKADNFL